MNDRICSFDYLRAFAIIGIILCHFFFNWNETLGLGRFCGNTFNALFIAMSGLLLGIKNSNSNNHKYSISFLKKRFTKLAISYYPFLVFAFLFYVFVEKNTLTIKDVLMHVLFLPWFDKLSGFEHLWFLTMIGVCYFSVFLYSKFKDSMENWFVGLNLLLSLIIGYFVEEKGLPGQMLVYLTLFMTCHYKVKDILRWLKNRDSVFVVSVSFCVIAGFLYLFYNGLYDQCRFLAEMGGALCAMAIFMSTVKLLENVKNNKVIGFVAGVSFEIYLVHHVFSFGRYSIMNIICNPVLGFICLLALSIALATVLRLVSKTIGKIILS